MDSYPRLRGLRGNEQCFYWHSDHGHGERLNALAEQFGGYKTGTSLRDREEHEHARASRAWPVAVRTWAPNGDDTPRRTGQLVCTGWPPHYHLRSPFVRGPERDGFPVIAH